MIRFGYTYCELQKNAACLCTLIRIIMLFKPDRILGLILYESVLRTRGRLIFSAYYMETDTLGI